MSLLLSPKNIGSGWRQLSVGEPVGTFAQYLCLDAMGILPSGWRNVPWFTKDGYKTLPMNHYRVPVSKGAWIQAIWAALPKLWRRKILRKKA